MKFDLEQHIENWVCSLSRDDVMSLPNDTSLYSSESE